MSDAFQSTITKRGFSLGIGIGFTNFTSMYEIPTCLYVASDCFCFDIVFISLGFKKLIIDCPGQVFRKIFIVAED